MPCQLLTYNSPEHPVISSTPGRHVCQAPTRRPPRDVTGEYPSLTLAHSLRYRTLSLRGNDSHAQDQRR